MFLFIGEKERTEQVDTWFEIRDLLTAEGDISQRVAQCYSELFRSEYLEDEETLNGFCSDLSRVSVDSAEQLGTPLMLSEVRTPLTSMQGGKAPVDGLPVEF